MSESDFSIKKVARDMPPSTLYVIKLKTNPKAILILFGEDGDFQRVETTYPTFSKTVGQREVRDARGTKFGADHWGYLPSGERWRFVRFQNGDRIGYEPVVPADADRLDEVLRSACSAPYEDSQQ